MSAYTNYKLCACVGVLLIKHSPGPWPQKQISNFPPRKTFVQIRKRTRGRRDLRVWTKMDKREGGSKKFYSRTNIWHAPFIREAASRPFGNLCRFWPWYGKGFLARQRKDMIPNCWPHGISRFQTWENSSKRLPLRNGKTFQPKQRPTP